MAWLFTRYRRIMAKPGHMSMPTGVFSRDIESRTGAPVAIVGADIASNLFPAGDAHGQAHKNNGPQPDHYRCA
jgi:hypothetical protein